MERLNFARGFKSTTSGTKSTQAKVVYRDDKFIAIVNNIEYDIHPDNLELIEYCTLYSLPSNERYCEWTKKHVNLNIEGRGGNNKKETILKAWSRVKPGKYFGTIIDNKFKIK